MSLSFGLSPCPNDTFMVDALLHGKIKTSAHKFNPVIEDVEDLNELAFRAALDITKLSYHAFLHLTDTYQMLSSGSALGFGVGPLLIGRQHMSEEEINDSVIALPGKWTTAHWLFSLRYPEATKKSFMLFSEIENAVAEGRVKAGVIIHENRFTYAQRGFVKIVDLGTYWEEQTGLPIPLGGIAVRRNMEESRKSSILQMLKSSIEFAYAHPGSASGFVHLHAQEMDPEILKKHIDLYVNAYSLDLKSEGRQAIQKMFDLSVEKGILKQYNPDYLFSG